MDSVSRRIYLCCKKPALSHLQLFTSVESRKAHYMHNSRHSREGLVRLANNIQATKQSEIENHIIIYEVHGELDLF